MRTCTHGRHTMVPETSQTTSFWPRFFYNTFLYLLTNLFIDVPFLYWQVFFRRVKETNKTTNLQAHFFCNAVLYCLTDLPIAIVYLYLQVFSFLEYFPQTNVFAWICTVYASLIIGCSIQYLKTGILRCTLYGCVLLIMGKNYWAPACTWRVLLILCVGALPVDCMWVGIKLPLSGMYCIFIVW